eukprot:c11133_g1_i1.p1 GENE.c11133_g1_i1~~c11133_g1_i1.p1  ORF type:complete len:245 (-),score=44.55 c11133_g1_i1:77-811(-)
MGEDFGCSTSPMEEFSFGLEGNNPILQLLKTNSWSVLDVIELIDDEPPTNGAEEFHQKEVSAKAALRKLQSRSDSKPDDIVTAMYHLATLYHNQKMNNKAEALLNRAVATAHSTLGQEHRLTLLLTSILGSFHQLCGDLTLAESLLRRAGVAMQRLWGSQNRDTIATATNLGIVMCLQGKLEEATPLLVNAAKKTTQLFGMQHPLTAMANHGLAKLREAEGNYEEAKRLRNLFPITTPNEAMRL